MQFLRVIDPGRVVVSFHQLFNFIVALNQKVPNEDTWPLFHLLIRKHHMKKIEGLRKQYGDALVDSPLKRNEEAILPHHILAIVVEWSYYKGISTEYTSLIFKKYTGFSIVIRGELQPNYRKYYGVYDYIYKLNKKDCIAVLDLFNLPSKDELVKIFAIRSLQVNKNARVGMFEMGLVYSLWYEYGGEIDDVKSYCKYINRILFNFNYSFLALRDRYWYHRKNTMGRNKHQEDYELYPIDILAKVFVFLNDDDYKNNMKHIFEEPKRMQLCRIGDKGGYHVTNCVYGMNYDNTCTANSHTNSDKIQKINNKFIKRLKYEQQVRKELPVLLVDLGRMFSGSSLYSCNYRRRNNVQTFNCHNFHFKA